MKISPFLFLNHLDIYLKSMRLIETGAYYRNWTYNLLDHTPIYQSENIYCQLFNY